jgi:methyl-accepting chemotaxis protein
MQYHSNPIKFQSIKSKISLIYILVNVVFLIVLIFSYWNYFYIDDELDANLLKANDLDEKTFHLQDNFLTQTIIWKNLLIRGKEKVEYDKLLNAFNQKIIEIDKKLEYLAKVAADKPELVKIINELKHQYSIMNARYLEALPVYKLAEHDEAITTDNYVLGIEDEAKHLFHLIIKASHSFHISQEAEIEKQALIVSIITLSISLVILSLLAVIFFYLIRNVIFKPLNRATELMKEIAEGDHDLTRRLESEGNDEFSIMGRFCNEFLDNVHDLMMQIVDTASNLTNASNATSRITQQTTNALRNQQTAIQEVVLSMDDMSRTVQTIATNAENAANNALMAQDKANSGMEAVKYTNSSIERLSGEVTEAQTVILNLANKSQSIGSIVGSINDISNQTNLLALNAAIEAARAGQHGRGFAVVADEVRALAAKTQQATDEIQAMISAIQTEVENAVDVMSRSHSEAQQTIEYSSQASDMLDEIMDAVDRILQINSGIASESAQQSQAAMNINSNVNKINQSIEDTIDFASKSTSDNGDLAQLSVMLFALISQFKLEKDISAMIEQQKHTFSNDKLEAELPELDAIELF